MLYSTLSSIPSHKLAGKTYNASRKILWLWIFVNVLLFLIYLSTISIAPYMHPDELMTVDLGRVILYPNTNWSIAWLTDKNQPVVSLFYVGPVLQELAYEFVGQYGPRIFALIGALFAANMLRQWFLARGTSQNLSFLLSLVFLLDPLFVQSYTMGRIDGWAMGLSLTACWLIRAANNDLSQRIFLKRRFILAGGLMVLALFTWPSGIFLAPLVLYEMMVLISKYRSINIHRKSVPLPAILFITGSLILGIFLIITIAPYLFTKSGNVIQSITTNTHSGSANKSFNFFDLFASVKEVFSVLKFTPVLSVMAFLGIIQKRDAGLIVSAMAATVLMICTLVYIQRVQYLLPYLVIFTAEMYSENHKMKKKEAWRRIKLVGLPLLLCWCICLSIFVRTILALDKKEGRNRDLIYHAAQLMIGNGTHNVFAPYEFYYTARSLNWKLYGPYIPMNDSFSLTTLRKILPHVDYIIMRSSAGMSPEFVKELDKNDMHSQGIYNIYNEPVQNFDGITTNVTRLRNLYSIFRQPYGPYELYVRETPVTH